MPRVLVIDPHEDARVILAAFLRHRGFEVETTAAPENLTGRLRSFRPDVVVSEYVPGFDHLIEEARRDHPSLPVVCWTTRSDRPCLDSLDQAACDYLMKPARPAQIEARIRATLEEAGGD